MEIAQHWRLNNQRYKLEGSICDECKTLSFPPREVCINCSEGHSQVIYDSKLEIKNATKEDINPKAII